MPVTKLGPHSRRSYAALQGREPSAVPCGVPGCQTGRVTEDCCYDHGLNKPIKGVRMNDGVIDFVAIDIAVDGSREVALTWVEWEIAAATILANEHPEAEVTRRLGRYPNKPLRRARIREIEAAIREERLDNRS